MSKVFVELDVGKLNGFIVVAPPFTRNSAGVYCLYKLAADLRSAGFQSFIFNGVKPDGCQTAFQLDTLSAKSAFVLSQLNFAVVYPETISGNPFKAKTVVRWVMNAPGKLGGDKKFADSELIFTYSTFFDKYVENQILGHLTCPVIDSAILSYDVSKIEKTDVSVYIGKGRMIDGLVPKYDNLMTRSSPSHMDTMEILKRTKTLYTFDRVTNLANEARFLGCEVVYMPNPDQELSLEENEFGRYGLHVYEEIACGKDKLAYDFQRISDEINLKFEKCVEQYRLQMFGLVDAVSKRI